MESDDIFIVRILSRREVLRLFGASSIVAIAGCGGGAAVTTGSNNNNGSGGTINLVVTPALVEGPFFVDEKLNRSDVTSGTSRASVINGMPLTLNFGVYSVSGGVGIPLSGAQVDIWHADAIGVYSDENNSGIQSENTLGQTFLRGYQLSDSSGTVQFKTIFPGW